MRVLLDTLVNVVGGVAFALQAVVVFVAEPALNQHGVELLAPFDGDGLVKKIVHRAVKRPQQHHRRIHGGKQPKRAGVHVLHGGVKPAGHKGAEHVEPHFGEQQHNHGGNHQQGAAGGFFV